jgi:hypothetical protein
MLPPLFLCSDCTAESSWHFGFQCWRLPSGALPPYSETILVIFEGL